MSSDESVIESDDDNDEDIGLHVPKKVFVRHTLNWRSSEFVNYIESLDRKIVRRRTQRGKQMVVPVRVGAASDRPPPENCPEWAYVADWAL